MPRDASDHPDGTLTGSGLSGTSGTYDLTGTGAEVTAALDALVHRVCCLADDKSTLCEIGSEGNLARQQLLPI